MRTRLQRLWPRRPGDGSLPLGMSCDDEGLLIAGNCRLIEAGLDREGRRHYRARPSNEVSALLSVGYGVAIDASDLAPALQRIAQYMTRREWPLAKIAAVQLGLPDLPDQRAARRVLEADELVKWTPALHPRWPARSTEGRGGEFRSGDGGDGTSLLTPVAEPFGAASPDDLEPRKRFQVNYHHWHDQALTKRYEEQGLLTPEAYKNLMSGRFARSEAIVQDITDPKSRVHMWDAAHRAASAAMKQISQAFLAEKGITPERPMTLDQSEELLKRLRTSEEPSLKAYRELLWEYQKAAEGIGFRVRITPPGEE